MMLKLILGKCESWKCGAEAHGTSTVSGRKLCKPHLNREWIREQNRKTSTNPKDTK